MALLNTFFYLYNKCVWNVWCLCRLCNLVYNKITRTYILPFLGYPEPPPLPPKKSDIEIYESTHLPRFLKLFSLESLESKDSEDHASNTNIDKIMYIPKEFTDVLKDEKNIYENKWKKQILYESTPRGNVIMFYDVYKQGFAYYSDQTMNYQILNVVAMKYCRYFGCRDFFIDEKILGSFTSPFIQFQKALEKEEETKKREKVGEIMPELKNAKLAKFKNYSVSNPNAPKKGDSEKKEPEPIWVTNKFVCLGKTSNFSFLQKRPLNKQRCLPIQTSTKFDAFFDNVSTDKLTYTSFKNFMLKTNA